MRDARSAGGRTLSEAWLASLELFRDPALIARIESERGVAFDVPGLTLRIEGPDPNERPGRYAFPFMIDAYLDRLFGASTDSSVIHKRLRHWQVGSKGSKELDQLGWVLSELRRTPDTRAASFSLWDPASDTESPFPISPVAGCLRIFDGALSLLLVARSTDFWMGAVPELIAFSQLMVESAASLGVRRGSLVYHCWSAHVYESDWQAHLA
jgi:hypothetical protein